MIELISIGREDNSTYILYKLLEERTPEQSISHKEMPSLLEHTHFVKNHPYLCWYLIKTSPNMYVGSIYLTKNRELGIFIFEHHKGFGYAEKAITSLLEKYPGRILANINPKNEVSLKFFKRLGAKHIQSTFEIE